MGSVPVVVMFLAQGNNNFLNMTQWLFKSPRNERQTSDRSQIYVIYVKKKILLRRDYDTLSSQVDENVEKNMFFNLDKWIWQTMHYAEVADIVCTKVNTGLKKSIWINATIFALCIF